MPGIFSFEQGGKQWKYPVEVSVRGNTSKYDCSFKKLALKFERSASGPLAGTSRLRINTHCGAKPGFTEMGRITGAAGPIREAMIYDWMRLLGLETYLSKLGEITYLNFGKKETISSSALFLEAKKDLGKRIGGKVLEEEDLEDQRAFLDRVVEKAEKPALLKGLLLNALIANGDFSLQLPDLKGERHFDPISPPSGMWNMLALDTGRELNVVPTDFDMASVVLQKDYESDPATKEISGCASALCEFQFLQLQKWRAFFTRPVFAQLSQEFREASGAMSAAVSENPSLGAKEKRYFLGALQSFLSVLATYEKVPVITEKTSVYCDPELTRACGMEEPSDKYEIVAPPGLPVKVLKRGSGSLEALLLDTRDHSLNNPDGGSCDGKVFLPAKIGISSDWPK